jgi:hypothetical protein
VSDEAEEKVLKHSQQVASRSGMNLIKLFKVIIAVPAKNYSVSWKQLWSTRSSFILPVDTMSQPLEHLKGALLGKHTHF